MEKDNRTIGKEYALNEYECGYCGHKFKQFVRSIMKDTTAGFEPKKACSSQVRCKCGAFLKTWDDGKLISVYTLKQGEKLKKRKYEIDEKIVS